MENAGLQPTRSRKPKLVRLLLQFGVVVLVGGLVLLAEAAAPKVPGIQAQQIPVCSGCAPGQILVKFRAGQSARQIDAVNAQMGGWTIQTFSLVPGLHAIGVPAGAEANAAAAYSGHPEVEYAEPDYLQYAAREPDDPRFPEQWALKNTGQTGGTPGADISAPAAWEITTGSSQVIVMVIDSGIDYTHPDLGANMWRNPGEIPGDGIDNDGDAWVDDVFGIDPHNLWAVSDAHFRFTLPPGTMGPVTILDTVIPPGIPTGTWEYEGILLEPALGTPMSRSVRPFSVSP